MKFGIVTLEVSLTHINLVDGIPLLVPVTCGNAVIADAKFWNHASLDRLSINV